MLNTEILRFGGLSLSHNPKTLKIVRKKKLNSLELVGGNNRLASVCDDISKISGTGELYGSDCFVQYEKLLRLSFLNKSEILSVPELGSFNAVLTNITVLAEPKKNILSVAFEFESVNSEYDSEKISHSKYYTADNNENLWDISYKFGIAIEKLVKLNPHIRDIQNLNEGEEVRLR